MFIVDAHQDIAYNTICFNRDYRVSALRKRQLEANTDVPRQNGVAVVGLPEAIAGRVAIVFATIFTAPNRGNSSVPWADLLYQTPQQAYQMGMRQFDVYQSLVDADSRLRLIQNEADLDTVLATWEEGALLTGRQQGLVLLMENADPISEPAQLPEWYERGLRIVGPAWTGSRYAGGTGMPGPFTADGRELLDRMIELNVVLDLSHIAEQSFYEALDRYDGPIIASHSNPRHFCNTDRHLSDDMIERLAERDGVMGITMLNYFLDGNWQSSDGKNAVTLNRVVEIADYICQLTGSAAYVGLGSDFDGGFGVESVPAEIDTVADLWQIKAALETRGYTDGDIAAILGGNMVRKLRQCLATA